jgi:hypothetical protein
MAGIVEAGTGITDMLASADARRAGKAAAPEIAGVYYPGIEGFTLNAGSRSGMKR